MGLRKIPFAIDEYYHIYNRGVDKRIIFENDTDRRRFLAILYLCNGEVAIDMYKLFREGQSFPNLFSFDRGEALVAIGAYCLMPNHFHILVKEIKEGGISLFMKKLQTAYSMYFNKKYERSGSLFQGPFGAQHVSDDRHLRYLFSYIHLNPIKLIDHDWKNKDILNIDNAERFLDSYSFSSFGEYRGISRPESAIVTKTAFPEYFETYKDFKVFIREWLTMPVPEDYPREE
jgi:putative transposase